jgi:transcriptional regulator with XRE-family HTH domain
MTTIETHTQATNGKLQNPLLLAPFSELSEKLLALRMALKLSQRDMGEVLGVSHGCISLWERGHPPHGPNMAMLRKFLGQNWSEVMDRGQGLKQAEPAPEFEFLEKPSMFIIERPGLAPLRFKGVELGTVLVGKGSVTLYETVGGSYVWDAGQELVESGDAEQPVDWGTANDFKLFAMGFSSNSTDDLLALANEHGLEIYEDIE